MKKLLFLLLAIVTLNSCSSDEERLAQCECTEEIQFYYIENGVSQPGDSYSNAIENPDCDTNGDTTTEDTPFNDGIIRKVTTINCN